LIKGKVPRRIKLILLGGPRESSPPMGHIQNTNEAVRVPEAGAEMANFACAKAAVGDSARRTTNATAENLNV